MRQAPHLVVRVKRRMKRWVDTQVQEGLDMGSNPIYFTNSFERSLKRLGWWLKYHEQRSEVTRKITDCSESSLIKVMTEFKVMLKEVTLNVSSGHPNLIDGVSPYRWWKILGHSKSTRLGVSEEDYKKETNTLSPILSVHPNHPPRIWSRLVGFFCPYNSLRLR